MDGIGSGKNDKCKQISEKKFQIQLDPNSQHWHSYIYKETGKKNKKKYVYERF